MSEGVNLISSNKSRGSLVAPKKLSVIRYIAIGLLFLVSSSAVILFILVALSPLPELQRQEQSLRFTLSQSHVEMGKLALISERTTSIKSIMKDRKSFDRLIGMVQSKIASDTTITALRLDKDSLIVTAESKSLQSIDNFLNGLIQDVADKQGFSQVTLTDLTSESNKTTYTATLRLVML